MRAKHQKAMIFDTDKSLSAKVHDLIKTLFSSTYVQNDPRVFGIDYGQLRPDLVFLNLNSSSRDSSFTFLQETFSTSSHKAIIFAYMDKIEPEIIAHAIENGVQDFFAKPFDQAIVASKVNRLIKSELTADQSLSYSKLRPTLPVKLDLPLKVSAVDENGITFSSPYYVVKGTKLSVTTPLIQQIFSVQSMDMMIVKTWLDEDKYQLFAEPWDASEDKSNALRRFILTKQ